MSVSNGATTLKRYFKRGKRVKQIDQFLVTVSADGTFDEAEKKTIDNTEQNVAAIFAHALATNQSGTNPTLQLVLQGKNLESGSFQNLGDGTETIDTSAADIATASTTAVDVYLDTANFDRIEFPPYLAVNSVIGGTNTPLGTYTMLVTVLRKFDV